MNKEWLEKCFKINNGIKFVDISLEISNSYLEQAENTLKKINNLILENDFLWASVMTYYCAYYSVYAFLQKIGIKSENHSCSIELFKYLIENEKLNIYIEKFRKQRIDAQYYLKFLNKEKYEENYNLLKEFYLNLLEIYEETSNDKINEYTKKIKMNLNSNEVEK